MGCSAKCRWKDGLNPQEAAQSMLCPATAVCEGGFQIPVLGSRGQLPLSNPKSAGQEGPGARLCSRCSPVRERDACGAEPSEVLVQGRDGPKAAGVPAVPGEADGSHGIRSWARGRGKAGTDAQERSRIVLQHRSGRLDGSGSGGSGLTFFSHCLERDSSELCGQACLRLGNKRGIFAILAGLLLELKLLWSQ